MNSQKVNDCVEVLCQSGCEMVRATITAMEEGQTVTQTAGLDGDESNTVLRELKAIMAVYDRKTS